MKLTPEQKEWWRKFIEALRSGRYKQGFWLLRYLDVDREECFCAEGVILDTYDPTRWSYIDREFKWVTKEGATTAIPTTIKTELGISNELVEVILSMNDADHKSFLAIANYLESRYEYQS